MSPKRRRSPLKTAALSSAALHGIAGSLRKQQYQRDLSSAQEWLWDVVLAELETRHRRTRGTLQCCCCDLCRAPFPSDHDEESPASV